MHSKNNSRLLWICFVGVILVLQGCSNDKLEAVNRFMVEEKSKQGPRIDPLPTARPYVAVIYENSGERSPFRIPREDESDISGDSVEAPDTNRPKTALERINIAELGMVGTIEIKGVRWALIDDGRGVVHRVKKGDYLGKNYGRIRSIITTKVEVIETKVDGRGGWFESPYHIDL